MEEQAAPIGAQVRRSIRNYGWMLVGFAIGGALLALVAALVQPIRYTASVDVLVGGVDLPASLEESVSAGLGRTGPLGLDLPAESQARVIASPATTSRAASALGLSDDEVQDFRSSVKARAVTDNVFVISVPGPSEDAAQQRVNAVAEAFLRNREEQVKSVLDSLSALAESRKSVATAQIAELQQRIDASLAAGATSDAASLRDQQLVARESLAAAETQLQDLQNLAATYQGGGQVLASSDSRPVERSPLVIRDAIFGALIGLLLGFLAALVRQKTSPFVEDLDEAAEAAQSDVVIAVARDKDAVTQLRAQAAAALMRTLPPPDPARASQTVLILRAIGNEETAASVCNAIAEAARSYGYSPNVSGPGRRSREPVPGPAPANAEPTSRSLRIQWIEDSPELGDYRSTNGNAVCLFVASIGRTRRAELVSAQREARMLGIPVRGIVLFGVYPDDETRGLAFFPITEYPQMRYNAPGDHPPADRK